ncbi:AraC-type DNA-binding protein [Lishizhenia tianjinensis]|uniref:AraC-type DNA-binding protein n=1 Tax=Lishizhenia tianjinensis TaxID=477690 RepID=A0A1I6XG04_9FLAO|nr:helix-turn-helix domain-containing protein [Lishizhenia tianjinensis]SFT36784.1 AraC-type DNA-binding protein [Lishizhenia tianjinensis]
MLHNLVELNDINSCYSQRTKHYDRHDCSEILWINYMEKGSSITVDSDTFTDLNYQFILIGKNQYAALNGRAKGLSLCLKNEFFRMGEFSTLRALFSPFVNTPVQAKEEDIEMLDSFLRLFHLEISGTNYQPILVSLLVGLLNKIYLLRPIEGARHKRSRRLEKLIDLVEENYTKNRGTSFYAKELGITPKRLNEILKERIGVTLNQFIANMIVLEAKRRLVLVDKNVNDISYELGFKEQAYFSRFFKKHTGQTPTEFISSTNRPTLP